MSPTGRRRVLFIAEAVTLAHAARVHALADALDPARFDVCVAVDGRYDALFGPVRYRKRPIASIASERFADAIARGAPVYDVETLSAYVDDDLRALAGFEPDVVVGDFRLSLSVSARVADTPYLTITNAGWSPFADIRFVVPDLPLNRWLGVGLAQRVFDVVRPIAFAAHARPVNRLRSRHGLAPLAADIRATYTDADSILYADLPELFSMRTMPESHAFLGPVQWSPALPVPAWWDRLPRDEPVVYVTLGSSGRSSVLPTLIDALSVLPLSVVVATAGRVDLPFVPSNVHVSSYLPGDVAAARAALVVCNGGSPTCYQAFAAGRPVIGIPTNLDQYLNMQAVVSSGAGTMLRPVGLDVRTVRDAVESLLADAGMQARAADLQRAIAASSPVDRLSEAIDAAASRADGSSARRTPEAVHADAVATP